MKSDIVCFSRKRYTVIVNGILVSPSWFVVPSIAYFRSMHRKLAENPRHTFVWQFRKATSYFCQEEVYRDSIVIPLLVLWYPQ